MPRAVRVANYNLEKLCDDEWIVYLHMHMIATHLNMEKDIVFYLVIDETRSDTSCFSMLEEADFLQEWVFSESEVANSFTEVVPYWS